MPNEIKLQSELKEKLGAFKHPNIGLSIYPAGKRLGDFEKADIFYPLTPSHFALFKLNVNTDATIFIEQTEFLFLTKYVFISSSMGLNFWERSDGSLDATGSTCKLLFEKSGLKGFDLLFDEVTKTQQFVIHLKDGNSFRSIAFASDSKVSGEFIADLNEAIKINKWL